MSVSLTRVPAWWFSAMPGTRPELLDLLAAVDRRGVEPNNRTEVERIWIEMRQARVIAQMQAAKEGAVEA